MRFVYKIIRPTCTALIKLSSNEKSHTGLTKKTGATLHFPEYLENYQR